jgi:hypothetical protein
MPHTLFFTFPHSLFLSPYYLDIDTETDITINKAKAPNPKIL